MSQSRRLLAAALVFCYALGLRACLLGRHTFHMDEALYASFSQRITHGDLLVTGGLNNDKPPLQFYLGALGIALFGDTESAVRIMDAGISALECALLAYFLWPLAGAGPALLAGALLAGSPLAASYGASGVMDGPFSFFMLASFCLAASSKNWEAGLCWALAAASKQTAYFMLPLPLLGAALAAPEAAGMLPALKRFGVGAAWALVPLFAWSALFQHPRMGMIFLMRSNQPEVGHLPSDWGGPLGRWWAMSGHLYAAPWLGPILLLVAPLAALGLSWLWRSEAQKRAWPIAGLMAPYGLLLFVGMNMRFFDRYMLPLVSFSALAAVLPLAQGKYLRHLAWPALALLLLANRQMGMGPDQVEVGSALNDGFPEMGAALKDLAPHGGALYSLESGAQWLGAYYLGRTWKLTEKQDPLALQAAMAAAGPQDSFVAERGGRQAPLPAGQRLKKIGAYGAWELFEVEPRGK